MKRGRENRGSRNMLGKWRGKKLFFGAKKKTKWITKTEK